MILTLAVTFAGMIVVMASAWLIQRAAHNIGWVDVVWTLGTGAMGVALSLAIWPPSWRQVVVALLVAIWSLRLGLHVAFRVASSPEDKRYVAIRQDWGSGLQRRLFWFLQAQAIVSTLLGLSILLAARNPAPGLRLGDIAGIAVLVIAIVGEAVADRQLDRFKKSGQAKDGLCEIGLWGWSRHPNYFFEWLAWIAYPLIAIDFGGANPWGWLALIAPLTMYWVLVYATGLPYLEAHMKRSRGAAFEAYSRRTNAFFPAPPRHPGS